MLQALCSGLGDTSGPRGANPLNRQMIDRATRAPQQESSTTTGDQAADIVSLTRLHLSSQVTHLASSRLLPSPLQHLIFAPRSSSLRSNLMCLPVMSPIPDGVDPLPRVVTYYQTLHDSSGKHISVLPFLTQPGIAITHVIVAAIHLNEDPNGMTLNDHVTDHPRYHAVWAELRILQSAGIKVMGMLGGAAKGSYQRLDASEEQFERYYLPLRDLIRQRGLDGLDLDVEEEMSLAGIMRLIDRLRSDFGKDFIITFAPVAMALLDFTKNLSGFDYEALEVMRGKDISWYNTQFYCGWGDMSSPLMYDMMIRKGWPAEKVVIGLVTNPANGPGFVPFEALTAVLNILRQRHGRFGGVMGWEYFNSLPGDKDRPWEWARQMSALLRRHALIPNAQLGIKPESQPTGKEMRPTGQEVDPDGTGRTKPLEVPQHFEYYSDEAGDD